VREESKLLNNLKRKLVSKKANLEDDLRDKIECGKIKMLDSRSESVKTEGGLVCPLCPQDCRSDSDLLDHMKRSHRTEMFGCSKCAGGSQPALAWSVEVLLQHLASQHSLNVSISEALSSYVNMPAKLHRVNCKLCLPPYILGTGGFWLGRDLVEIMEDVETHFERVHGIQEKNQVVSKLELACRGCDVTLSHAGRLEWHQHVLRRHCSSRAQGPGSRCGYCGETVLQSETIRHLKESHSNETFQCKPCLDLDPTCFPYSDTIKEMMQHMVMKHGDQFSSYYDHMIYPTTLFGSLCSNSDCSDSGLVLAFDAATIGKHLRVHQETGGGEQGEFYCRCCDRIKQRFKSIDEVKAHIAKRHKTILKWKAVNGNE